MSTNLRTALGLSRARALVVRDVDESLGSHHGLGLNDLAVLLELQAAPGGRMRRAELARRLAVTTSGVARQLQPLERIGVVDRESNPTDARLAIVVLTPTGERARDRRGCHGGDGGSACPGTRVVRRRDRRARVAARARERRRRALAGLERARRMAPPGSSILISPNDTIVLYPAKAWCAAWTRY